MKGAGSHQEPSSSGAANVSTPPNPHSKPTYTLNPLKSYKLTNSVVDRSKVPSFKRLLQLASLQLKSASDVQAKAKVAPDGNHAHTTNENECDICQGLNSVQLQQQYTFTAIEGLTNEVVAQIPAKYWDQHYQKEILDSVLIIKEKLRPLNMQIKDLLSIINASLQATAATWNCLLGEVKQLGIGQQQTINAIEKLCGYLADAEPTTEVNEQFIVALFESAGASQQYRRQLTTSNSLNDKASLEDRQQIRALALCHSVQLSQSGKLKSLIELQNVDPQLLKLSQEDLASTKLPTGLNAPFVPYTPQGSKNVQYVPYWSLRAMSSRVQESTKRIQSNGTQSKSKIRKQLQQIGAEKQLSMIAETVAVNKLTTLYPHLKEELEDQARQIQGYKSLRKVRYGELKDVSRDNVANAEMVGQIKVQDRKGFDQQSQHQNQNGLSQQQQ